MKPSREMMMDKRLQRRHLERGLVSQAELDAHLAGLPDVGDRARKMRVDLSAMGIARVQRVEAEDHEE